MLWISELRKEDRNPKEVDGKMQAGHLLIILVRLRLVAMEKAVAIRILERVAEAEPDIMGVLVATGTVVAAGLPTSMAIAAARSKIPHTYSRAPA